MIPTPDLIAWSRISSAVGKGRLKPWMLCDGLGGLALIPPLLPPSPWCRGATEAPRGGYHFPSPHLLSIMLRRASIALLATSLVVQQLSFVQGTKMFVGNLQHGPLNMTPNRCFRPGIHRETDQTIRA